MHGQRLHRAVLEGMALCVIAVADEASREVDVKAGEAREGDLVSRFDQPCVLGLGWRRCGSAQPKRGPQGPTKTHEIALPRCLLRPLSHHTSPSPAKPPHSS